MLVGCASQSGMGRTSSGADWRAGDVDLSAQFLRSGGKLFYGVRSAVIRPTTQAATAVPEKTRRAWDQLSAVR